MGWDAASGMVTLTKGSDQITLKAGSSTATKNGEEVELSITPYVVDGVTYVPMSFVQGL